MNMAFHSRNILNTKRLEIAHIAISKTRLNKVCQTHDATLCSYSKNEKHLSILVWRDPRKLSNVEKQQN